MAAGGVELDLVLDLVQALLALVLEVIKVALALVLVNRLQRNPLPVVFLLGRLPRRLVAVLVLAQLQLRLLLEVITMAVVLALVLVAVAVAMCLRLGLLASEHPTLKMLQPLLPRVQAIRCAKTLYNWLSSHARAAVCNTHAMCASLRWLQEVTWCTALIA